jgi:short-subunit dehydrogenase
MAMKQESHKGTALITGASAGIGATYADRLAGRGYDLVLVARDGARLEELGARLRKEHGVRVESIRADLTQAADLAQIEQRLRTDERIALLVNNAGVSVSGPFIGNDIDRITAMIQLNVVAVTRLAATALPGFVARGQGTLINVGSVLALAAEMFSGSYSGTKAFVLNLTQSIQKEVAGSGVRVQAVLPGATRTEIWDRSGTGLANVPEDILMDVGEMVDAALAGLDQGEAVTIPSLPDVADWEAYTEARLRLGPNLSRKHAAGRYRASGAVAKV